MSPLEESLLKRRDFISKVGAIRDQFGGDPVLSKLKESLRSVGVSFDMHVGLLELSTISIMDPEGRIYAEPDVGDWRREVTMRLLRNMLARYTEEVERDERRLRGECRPWSKILLIQSDRSDDWHGALIEEYRSAGFHLTLSSDQPIVVRAPKGVVAGANVTIVRKGPFARFIEANKASEEPVEIESEAEVRRLLRIRHGISPELSHYNGDGDRCPHSTIADKDPCVIGINRAADELARRKPVSVIVQEQSPWADDL